MDARYDDKKPLLSNKHNVAGGRMHVLKVTTYYLEHTLVQSEHRGGFRGSGPDDLTPLLNSACVKI